MTVSAVDFSKLNLHFLGEMDNIGYYVENTTELVPKTSNFILKELDQSYKTNIFFIFKTWHEAGALCQAHGMELTSIRTKAQSQMLSDAVLDYTGWCKLARQAIELKCSAKLL